MNIESKQKFEGGDLVYVPAISNKVYKLVKDTSDNYPLAIFDGHGNRVNTFTIGGKIVTTDLVQGVFLATPENKACLDKLYGLDFEVYVDKNSSEYTKKLLKESGKSVLCFCNDSGDDRLVNCTGNVNVIQSFNEVSGKFKTINGVSYRFAIPVFDRVDITTGANEDE